MSSIRSLLRRPTRPDLPWMLPEDEFRRLLERERARAERNRRSFSVVELETAAASVPLIVRVLDLLKNRRRLTDDIGWIRKDAIGVLLAETDGAGAASYLDDVRKLLAKAECALPARLFVYEGDAFDGGNLGFERRRPGETQSAFRRRAQDRQDPSAPPPSWPPRTPADGPPPPAVPAGDGGNRGAMPVPTDRQPDSDPDGEPPATFGPEAGVADMQDLFQQPLPWWKRATDVVGGWLLLVGISPVLLLIAVLVKATSRGPIIFRQWRAGRGGQPFLFYKFRTMIDGADALKEGLRASNEVSGPVFKMRRDPRVTALGRVLRRSSLDELPQLWNVIKGDMSLVGPRPPTLDEVPKYLDWQRRRLDLTGGITGLWQVSGRNDVSFEEWMRMDIRYSRTRSPMNDLRILLRTIRAVVTGRGAS